METSAAACIIKPVNTVPTIAVDRACISSSDLIFFLAPCLAQLIIARDKLQGASAVIPISPILI